MPLEIGIVPASALLPGFPTPNPRSIEEAPMGTSKRILSIDWDYFFPSTKGYDWGHSEMRAFFYQIVWQMRLSCRDMYTGERMTSVFKPHVPRNFWSLVTNRPRSVWVADSHVNLWDRLKNVRHAHVVSLDAHHDCGYEQPKDMVDCSNWGYWGVLTSRIEKLDLYYPEWRKDDPEGKCQTAKDFGFPNTHYGLPEPAAYDEVFVCRSGVWCPPWYDRRFREFVRASRLKIRHMDKLSWQQRTPATLRAATAEGDLMADSFKKMMEAQNEMVQA
jgi:hypothetical protein